MTKKAKATLKFCLETDNAVFAILTRLANRILTGFDGRLKAQNCKRWISKNLARMHFLRQFVNRLRKTVFCSCLT